MTLTTNLGPWQVVTIVLTLALGLAVDVRIDIVGQAFLSAAIWAVMFCLLARFAPNERYVLMACLTIATAGELVLSLAWGLYTYRLGNVPLFVPPGHVLLLMLGLWLARWISDRRAQMVIGCAGLYALAVIGAGLDTLAGPLFLVVVVAWIVLPAHQRLYASTFLLSLVLELYGTWLGNWSWALAVPGMPLVTTNPPGTVGAFYCALDALVVAATVHVLPRMRACTA